MLANKKFKGRNIAIHGLLIGNLVHVYVTCFEAACAVSLWSQLS
jgi:hypothetical protein